MQEEKREKEKKRKGAIRIFFPSFLSFFFFFSTFRPQPLEKPSTVSIPPTPRAARFDAALTRH